MVCGCLSDQLVNIFHTIVFSICWGRRVCGLRFLDWISKDLFHVWKPMDLGPGDVWLSYMKRALQKRHELTCQLQVLSFGIMHEAFIQQRF